MIHASTQGVDITETQWPYCSAIRGTCLILDLAKILGNNIHESLMAFAQGAEPGSRLTLQRNRDGFTAQVTGPVQRSEQEAPGLTQLRALREQLDMLAS